MGCLFRTSEYVGRLFVFTSFVQGDIDMYSIPILTKDVDVRTQSFNNFSTFDKVYLLYKSRNSKVVSTIKKEY